MSNIQAIQWFQASPESFVVPLVVIVGLALLAVKRGEWHAY